MNERHLSAKVMIVDDEPANILLLERTFKQVGFKEFELVTNPTRVIGLLDEFKPDILLLDLQMPELDGFGVMQEVKDHISADDFLPILVLTADASQQTKRKALAQGANDFLTKPFDLLEAVLRTRNLLTSRFLHCDLHSQNDALEERVRERTRELEDAHLEVLGRLVKVGEYRDDETGEHAKRVGNMSAMIARVLGLEVDEVEMIRLAAQLHDIGKVGIPDRILLKEGKLTSEEFDVIKGHTAIGSSILEGSTAKLLQMAEVIALTHHEHWSGNGYPNGLGGEDIPLVGRIVAVSDVFDALTHDRPYKRAWSVEQAVSEISRLAGEQFDPRVVQALLSTLRAAGLYLEAA
jgi:putative two-component system response regulator